MAEVWSTVGLMKYGEKAQGPWLALPAQSKGDSLGFLEVRGFRV